MKEESKIIAKMAKTRSGSPRCSRRRRTAAFADGGKVETAEELIRRMNEKYGLGGKSQPDPVPQPAPVAPQIAM
jgi:hypothetical protein